MTTNEPASALSDLHFSFLREFSKLRAITPLLEKIDEDLTEPKDALTGVICILEDMAENMQKLCDQLDRLTARENSAAL